MLKMIVVTMKQNPNTNKRHMEATLCVGQADLLLAISRQRASRTAAASLSHIIGPGSTIFALSTGDEFSKFPFESCQMCSCCVWDKLRDSEVSWSSYVID